MTRAELEARLLELERTIEASKTAQWLAEFERDQLRHELRLALYAETKEKTK